MSITHTSQQAMVEVLKNHAQYGRSELLKALYDVRYNTSYAEDDIVFPLLTHADDGVVAAALLTLWHGYGARDRLLPLIKKLAKGDERDTMTMPIQTTAIDLLAEIAGSDPAAHDEIIGIAEDHTVRESPRKTAWMKLAELHGVEWLREYSDEMILAPDSEKCEAIRERVRQAIPRSVQRPDDAGTAGR